MDSELCICSGCDKNAASTLTVFLGKAVLYLNVCQNKSHCKTVFHIKKNIEDGHCPEELAEGGEIEINRLHIRFGGTNVVKTPYIPGQYAEFFEKTPRRKFDMKPVARSSDGLDPEKHPRPQLPGFSSHMAAAKPGCPICGEPLQPLEAERTDKGWWKNYCKERGCTGVIEYTIDYETAARAAEETQRQEAVRAKHAVQEDSPPVCENWEFVPNMYEWMTVEGKILPIKKLPEKEFVDSVWALVHANFSKVSSKMAWVKGLPTFGVPYSYPREALAIGAGDAKEKIEEFYENAVERGWVTPERE